MSEHHHFFMVNGDEEIHLHSPSGKAFKFSVTDDGVLVTIDEETDEAAKGSCLPLSGGVMSGDLILGSSDSATAVQFKQKKLGSDGSKREVVQYISNGNMARFDLMSDGKVINFMQLGPSETGFSKPVRVSSGGTGVTSLVELKEALGLTALEARVKTLEG